MQRRVPVFNIYCNRVLVTEDEYVTDIRSATVFTENECVLSSSSMDENVIDEKTRIERYAAEEWLYGKKKQDHDCR